MNSLIYYVAIPSLLAVVAVATVAGLLAKSAKHHRSAHFTKSTIVDTILRQHPDAVALTNDNGSIQGTSKPFDRCFEWRATPGKTPNSILNVIFESSRYDYNRILEYVRRERKPVVRFAVRTTSGELDRDLIVTVTPIIDRHDKILGLLHVFEHAAGRERLDPDLGHIEKLTNVGQIAAGMAHELNTPLGSIILSADIIRDTYVPPLVAEEAKKIKSQAEHCSKVVKKLLRYVRKDDDLKTKCDVSAIIEKVRDLVETESRKRNIVITIEGTPEETAVLCNENQMEQLFFNLFSNAFHAIDTNGHITIRVRRDALLSQVLVVFSDNGCGIPEENIDRIFVPFFTTKPHTEGTGLGLALCQRIVFGHGGKIEVASTLGKGTSFTLCFPVA